MNWRIITNEMEGSEGNEREDKVKNSDNYRKLDQ
jgi:hypothetical protein